MPMTDLLKLNRLAKPLTLDEGLKILARPRNLWVRIRGIDATCGRSSRRNAAARLSHCGWPDHQIRGWTVGAAARWGVCGETCRNAGRG